MNPARALAVATSLLLGAAAAGCADNGNTDTAATNATSKRVERGLPRPLHLRCKVQGFNTPPRIREFETSGNIGKAWSLQYTRTQPPDQPDADRPTTTVLIVQSAPTNERAKRQARTKDLTIAGHRVEWRDPTQRFRSYSAQWSTPNALYTAVATGATPTTLRRFITCLP